MPHDDARLDFTDLYAFPKPGDASRSILIMNVHPSVAVAPPGPTTPTPFTPDGLYEIRIDTNGDCVADIAYRVRFSPFAGGAQTATVRRAEGAEAAGVGEGGAGDRRRRAGLDRPRGAGDGEPATTASSPAGAATRSSST